MFPRIPAGPTMPAPTDCHMPLEAAAAPSAIAAAAAAEAAPPADGEGTSRAAPAIAAPHDPEAAAAHRFWLPNDVWNSITEFSSRADVLNLRTVSRELNSQADQAIETLTIRPADHRHVLAPRDLMGFIDSTSFKHVRTLRLGDLDGAALRILTLHLEAHPRPKLTLHLGMVGQYAAQDMARLSALQLKALVLDPAPRADILDALAACAFPVDLAGEFHDEMFIAAANMPTLRSLEAISQGMTDELASRFSAHPALEILAFGVDEHTTSDAIQTLASLPTLRALRVDGYRNFAFDSAAAGALAANANFVKLEMASNLMLAEESFAALAQSGSLTTLVVPCRPAMVALGGMRSLRELVFNNDDRYLGRVKMDLATARSIAGLPALQSITFPFMEHESGVLKAIVETSPVANLTFPEYVSFTEDELGALAANRTLKEVTVDLGGMHPRTVAAMCDHPTIDRLRFMQGEYRRIPGNATLTAFGAPPPREQIQR